MLLMVGVKATEQTFRWILWGWEVRVTKFGAMMWFWRKSRETILSCPFGQMRIKRSFSYFYCPQCRQITSALSQKNYVRNTILVCMVGLTSGLLRPSNAKRYYENWARQDLNRLTDKIWWNEPILFMFYYVFSSFWCFSERLCLFFSFFRHVWKIPSSLFSLKNMFS